jgi:hypothetical protein
VFLSFPPLSLLENNWQWDFYSRNQFLRPDKAQYEAHTACPAIEKEIPAKFSRLEFR